MVASLIALMQILVWRGASGQQWIQSTGGSKSMCAAGPPLGSSCSGVPACTQTSYGPCGGVASGAAPPFYLQGFVASMAAISGTDTGYLTNSAFATMLIPSTSSNNGYYSANANSSIGSATYASVTSGGYFAPAGDPSNAVAYVGMSAALITSGTYAASFVPFTVATVIGSAGTSTFNTCIAPLANGACGTAAAFAAGAFKFSLFGYTTSSYQYTPSNTWFGVRTQLSLLPAGLGVTATLNGNVPLANNGGINVTSMTLSFGGNTITIDFPQTYNVGMCSNSGPYTPNATRTVAIKVTQDGSNSVFIDYLFALSDFTGPSIYFVYDPTVTQTAAAGGSSATSSTLQSAGASTTQNLGSTTASGSATTVSSSASSAATTGLRATVGSAFRILGQAELVTFLAIVLVICF